MSKFIKVQLEINNEWLLLNASTVKEVGRDKDGYTEIHTQDGSLVVHQSIEQIEAQLLRDEFAIAALNATIIGLNSIVENYEHHGWSDQELVSESYRVADAMLKERLK